MMKITFVKFIEAEVQNVCRHKSQNRGCNHITLEASSLKFKARNTAKMRECPRNAAADEKYSAPVQLVSL
jgi:hypothetical protein